MTIKALIFDLDGVITDTVEFHFRSWKRLADEEGVPFSRAESDALRGRTRRASLEIFLKGKQIDEETAQAWMARKNAYFHEFVDNMTPADRLPGVTRFLDEARERGLKIGIASASRNARRVLEKLDLLDTFDVIGDAYVIHNPKPAPDSFVWAAGGLGVRVDEVVVFEDAEAGVDAALAGGFKVVGLGSAPVGHAHLVLPDLAEAHVDDVLARLGVKS